MPTISGKERILVIQDAVAVWATRAEITAILAATYRPSPLYNPIVRASAIQGDERLVANQDGHRFSMTLNELTTFLAGSGAAYPVNGNGVLGVISGRERIVAIQDDQLVEFNVQEFQTFNALAAPPVAPTITSSNSTSIAENTKLAFALTANNPVTWSIVGGADAALLEISGSTLRFLGDGVADYETKTSYAVQIRATNIVGGLFTNQNFSLTITDQDEIPNAFSFTDVTGADLSTVITSDQITVAGLGSGVSTPISVSGGEYQKNGGAWTSTTGIVVNGDTVRVRRSSSASYETAVTVTLTIGGVSDTFSITTAAEVSEWPKTVTGVGASSGMLNASTVNQEISLLKPVGQIEFDLGIGMDATGANGLIYRFASGFFTLYFVNAGVETSSAFVNFKALNFEGLTVGDRLRARIYEPLEGETLGDIALFVNDTEVPESRLLGSHFTAGNAPRSTYCKYVRTFGAATVDVTYGPFPDGGGAVEDDDLIDNPVLAPEPLNGQTSSTALLDAESNAHFIRATLPSPGYEHRLRVDAVDADNDWSVTFFGGDRATLYKKVDGVQTEIPIRNFVQLPVTPTITELVQEKPSNQLKLFLDGEEFEAFRYPGSSGQSRTDFGNGTNVKFETAGSSPVDLLYGSSQPPVLVHSAAVNRSTGRIETEVRYTGQPTGFDYSIDNGATWARLELVSATKGVAFYQTPVITDPYTNIIVAQKDDHSARDEKFVTGPTLMGMNVNDGGTYYSPEGSSFRDWKNLGGYLRINDIDDRDTMRSNGWIDAHGRLVSIVGATGTIQILVPTQPHSSELGVRTFILPPGQNFTVNNLTGDGAAITVTKNLGTGVHTIDFAGDEDGSILCEIIIDKTSFVPWTGNHGSMRKAGETGDEAAQIWTDLAVSDVSAFNLLRFMDPMRANLGGWGDFANRWHVGYTAEAIIELCNRARAIPALVFGYNTSPADAVSYCTLIRDGLDPVLRYKGYAGGVDPFNEPWNNSLGVLRNGLPFNNLWHQQAIDGMLRGYGTGDGYSQPTYEPEDLIAINIDQAWTNGGAATTTVAMVPGDKFIASVSGRGVHMWECIVAAPIGTVVPVTSNTWFNRISNGDIANARERGARSYDLLLAVRDGCPEFFRGLNSQQGFGKTSTDYVSATFNQTDGGTDRCSMIINTVGTAPYVAFHTPSEADIIALPAGATRQAAMLASARYDLENVRMLVALSAMATWEELAKEEEAHGRTAITLKGFFYECSDHMWLNGGYTTPQKAGLGADLAAVFASPGITDLYEDIYAAYSASNAFAIISYMQGPGRMSVGDNQIFRFDHMDRAGDTTTPRWVADKAAAALYGMDKV